MRRTGAALAALCASLLLAASATADPAVPLGHAGRWITDANGRVVILHGLNMVYKAPPYAPSASGFGADDAQFLRDNGFNTVRLGLIYKAVEPQPGVYDTAYLNDIAATEKTLADHGVFSLLDMHQDLYNERFQGEGWPDWAVQDDGLPALPQLGFPGNYFGMPALIRAFDHFWANSAGPGGVGLQDRYAAAWRQIAERFRSSQGTIGFDIMNEPWPGSSWPTCSVPAVGCPLFDSGPLAGFNQRVDAQIRAAEPQKLVWYEPNVIFDFGAPTNLPPLGDEQAGMSFHNYCLPAGLGIPGFPAQACDPLEQTVFSNADSHVQQTGDALILSEFGATDDLAALSRLVTDADNHMVSWQEWQYCGCSDPTTQSSASTEALVIDPSKPPTGDNVKTAKLAVLSRPYPQVVAGTPLSYSFDPASKHFQLNYSIARAGGGPSFEPVAAGAGQVDPSSPQTEVFIPEIHYPGGYEVDATGAAIASPPGSRTLRLIACPGVTSVSVSVNPPGHGAVKAPECTVAAPASATSPATAGGKHRNCRRLRMRLRRARARGDQARAAKLHRRLRHCRAKPRVA